VSTEVLAETIGEVIERCYHRSLIDWRTNIGPKLHEDEAIALRFQAAEINCLLNRKRQLTISITVQGINIHESFTSVFRAEMVRPGWWQIVTDSVSMS
jgi:hypothetical protein